MRRFFVRTSFGRWRLGWLPVAVLLMAAACAPDPGKDKDQKPVHPVRGQVFAKGQPADGAFVLLVPLNEPAEPKDPRPRAYVEKDGSFTLSTYGDKDGAPAGEYVVTVTWSEREGSEDRLQGQYRDPKKSTLRATVKEGPNDLPAFRLP